MEKNPPNWLDKIGKHYWRQFQSKVSDDDSELLALLCNSLSMYRHAHQALSEKGVLLDNGKGGLKQNPASYVLRDTHSQAVAALKALRLTPDTRQESPHDYFDELDRFMQR